MPKRLLCGYHLQNLMTENASEILESVVSFNNEKLSRILHDANSNDFLYTGTVNTTHWMIPALHAAAYKGYDDIIYTLLSSEDLDVDQQDDFGTTALMEATDRNNISTVEVLLEEGANVNAQNWDGWTALMVASWEGHLEVITKLLQAGANMHIQNNFKETALSLAKSEELRKMLYDYDSLASRIHKAAVTGNENSLARLLLATTSAHLGYAAQVGGRPLPVLLAAACKGHLTIVQMLLQTEKVDVDQADCKRKRTALMQAAYEGHIEIVEFLLQEGADIDAADKEGSTALICATFNNDLPIMTVLLAAGADVHSQGIYDRTALMTASDRGDVQAVQLLLSAGSDIHMLDRFGQSAFCSACHQQHIVVMTILLQAGSDIRTKDTMGMTTLWYACKHGHTAVVRFLLQAGANVHDTDDSQEHKTALKFARESSQSDVIKELLLQAGAIDETVSS